MTLRTIGRTLAGQAQAPAAVQAAETPSPPLHPGAISAGALLDSAPVAVYHADAAGNMVYSNAEYRRIFGLELVHGPDDWARRVHPDDRVRMQQAWADFCRQPAPRRFAYRTQYDGEIRHFSEQVVAVEGGSGWVGTITDVTDLINARDHLRKAESLFRNTFDQAPIGIAHADRRGRLLRYNQAFCAMLGFDPGELANKPIGDLTHHDDIARVSAELKRLWNGEEGWEPPVGSDNDGAGSRGRR
jgi:PAS domain S-box-containing protein